MLACFLANFTIIFPSQLYYLTLHLATLDSDSNSSPTSPPAIYIKIPYDTFFLNHPLFFIKLYDRSQCYKKCQWRHLVTFIDIEINRSNLDLEYNVTTPLY